MEVYRNEDSIELDCVWSSKKVESLRAAACLSLPIMPRVAEALEVWVSAETECLLWHCSSEPWPLLARQYLQLCRCVLFSHRVQARLKPGTHPVRLWTPAFRKSSVWFGVVLFLICCISIFGHFVRNLQKPRGLQMQWLSCQSLVCFGRKKRKLCVADDCKNNCVICAPRRKH